ncbi:MAG: hypothetical protein JOZ57_07285, partial [Abitibacteriaceae bacterium]|nr:hypothetical protein [Abditibacteriaceae bacterium]
DMSKSIGSAYASEAWQKWVTVHSNELLPEIKERIDGAATEGEWFDRLENERQKLGDTLVWHRATLARFNQIFKSNGWELDPPEDQLSHVLRTYLKHDYKEYVTARREVLRRLDATREQIILTGYYSGVAEYENTNP